MYFITIVTQNRECNLGKIIRSKCIEKHDGISMMLSEFGTIVHNEWIKSFEIRNELFCDEYIIMPNHLHAIVVLNKPEINQNDDAHDVVETHGRASLQRKPQSISSFVAGFKSAVNSAIDDYIDEHQWDIPKYNRNNHFFQSNYHDHIIRDDGEYQRIKQYIINNPLKWMKDRLYPQ